MFFSLSLGLAEVSRLSREDIYEMLFPVFSLVSCLSFCWCRIVAIWLLIAEDCPFCTLISTSFLDLILRIVNCFASICLLELYP